MIRSLWIITTVTFLYIIVSIVPLYAAGQPVQGAEVSVSKPTVYNLTLTAADTQYQQTFTNVKSLWFQCRTAADIRYAFVTGKVATPTAPWMTLKSGQVFEEYNISISSFTVYFAGDAGGEVVEIEKW